MKNIHRKATALLVSSACILGSAVPALAEAKTSTTVSKNKTGTLMLDYKDDSEGKKPVVGAEFTLYKIGAMVMPLTDPVITSATADVSDQAVTPDTVNQADSADQADTSDQTSGTVGNSSYVSGSVSSAEDDSSKGASGTSNDGSTFSIVKRMLNVFASKVNAASGTNTSASTSEDKSPVATSGDKDATVETYYKPLIEGVKADSTVNPVKIEKKVRAAYKAGVKGGKHYTLRTNASGMAKRSGISQGLYLAVETKPAKEHFASIPFMVSIPQMVYKNDGSKQGWYFNVKAYPKSLPAGDLKIGKKVTGNDGERNKTFHFNVNLDLSKADSTSGKTSADRYTDKYASGQAPNGYHTAQSDIKDKNYGRTYDRASRKYKYTTSDGRKGTIGTKGTISLKSGQTATIKCIPIGTAYKVTEQEANQNRYKTTVKNDEGAITQHKVQKVSFINRRTRKPVHHGTGRVKTGDNTRLAMYVAILAAALSAVILALRRIHRRRKED